MEASVTRRSVANFRWAWPLAVATILVAAIYLMLAGAVKLRDIEAFDRALESHRLLQPPLRRFVPLPLAAMEFFTGGFVLFWLANKRSLAAPATCLSFILGAFALYAIAVALYGRGTGGSCACGLVAAPVTSWMSLAVRNTTLSMLFALLAWRAPQPWPPRQ